MSLNDKYEYIQSIDFNTVKGMLPKRFEHFHKGNFGKLFCVCGSKNMPGAAVMSMLGALKSGVGMVKSAVLSSNYEIIARKIPEAVFSVFDENEDGTFKKDNCETLLKESENCTASLIGCGLGLNDDIKEIVRYLIKNLTVPIVLDADGINAISRNIDVLKEAKKPVVVTPHPGEAARLLNISAEDINVNRVKCAKDFAKKFNVVMVLKGPNTVIADPSGEVFVNTTGNVGMAKGGSGDVLSGILASFLAQGLSACDSAICGVYIHGAAGDLCKSRLSSVSMLPTDIIGELANIFLKFEK